MFLPIETLKLMAQQGHPGAMYAIGMCYHMGDGVRQDDREALKWWRMAADFGSPEAQCELGECYCIGRGVNKNITEACFWMYLAAVNGSEEAVEWIKRYKGVLNQEQLNNISNRAEAWIANHTGN